MPDGRLPLVANLGDLSYEKFLERTKRLPFENVGRGLLQGAGEGVTSSLKVADYLIPGNAVTRYAEEREREMQDFYDPYGAGGTFGRVVGRLGGEIAQAGLTAAPAAKAVTALPVVGSRVARALGSASRLERGLGAAAAGAPIEIAQGLKSETPFLLPEGTGRAGSVLEGLLISGGVGAAMPRTPRPTTQYSEPIGPVAPEMRPDRMLPQRSVTTPVATTQYNAPAGPGIPMAASIEDLRRLGAEATPEDIAAYLAQRGRREQIAGRGGIPSTTGRTARRPGQPVIPEQSALEFGPSRELEPEAPVVREPEAPRPVAPAQLRPEEVQRYPLSYYASWLMGDAKTFAERAPTLDGVKIAGVAGNPADGYFTVTIKRKRGQKEYAYVRPQLQPDGTLGLERVDVTDAGVVPSGEMARLGSVPQAPVPSETQLNKWAKSEARLSRKAEAGEELEIGAPKKKGAQAVKLTEVEKELAAEREAIQAVEGDTGQLYTMPLEELQALRPKGVLKEGRLPNLTAGELEAELAYETRMLRRHAEDAGFLADEYSAIDFYADTYTRRTMGYQGAKKYFGTAEEARKAKGMSEEMLGALEERNISVEDFREMQAADAKRVATEKRLAKLQDEYDRRGLGDEDVSFDPNEFMGGGDGMTAYDIGGVAGAGLRRAVSDPITGALVGGAAGGLSSSDEGPGGIAAGALLGATAGGLGVRLLRGRARVPVGGTTDAINNYLGSIRIGDRAAPEKWLTGRERAYTGIVSETYPLVKAGREAVGEAGGQAVLEAVAKAQGGGGTALQYIDDRIKPVLESVRGKWDNVRALLKARRDLNIRQYGGGYTITNAAGNVVRESVTPAQLREMGPLPAGQKATAVRGATKSRYTDDEVRRVVADAEADPAVRRAADAINAIYKDLLDRRFAAGLLDEDEYKRILQSEDFYDPFVREFGEEMAVSGAGGRKWVSSSSGVRKMDRMAEASADTADPLEVLVTSVNRTVADVGRQNVANIIFELADLGELPMIRIVDGPVTPNSRRFRVIRNGTPVTYEVLDKDLYEALAGMSQSPSTAGPMIEFARRVKEVKQFGITQNPVFALVNLGRDVAASGIQRVDRARAIREGLAGSAIGGAVGGLTADEGERLRGMLRGATAGAGLGMYARPVAEVMSAMKNIYKNDEVFKEFLREGGSTEGFFVRSPSDARKVLGQLERSGVSASDIVSPRRWVDAMRAIGSVSEQATRVATYKQMLGQGATREAAVLAAQDRTLRFANVGKDTKGIAKVTAFWNAKIQGWDKLFRMIKDPKTSALALTMITAPTIALWTVNKDNPEYWERPQWERNLFWLIPKTGGGFWRYPKPFEIGYIFASLPERMLDYYAQAGVDVPALGTVSSAAPETATPGRTLRGSLKEMVASTVEGTVPLPDVVAAPIQLATNYDMFRSRRIVTQPNLPAAQQVAPESSALARALARGAGVSPQQTDFFVRNQFGTLGQEALRAGDVVARMAGADAPVPRARGAGVAKAIPMRFQTQPYSATDTESQARDILADLDKVNAGLRAEERGGDTGAVEQYTKKNLGNVRAYNELSGLRRELDGIAAQRRALTRNPAVTPERKRVRLDELRKQGDFVARDILRLYRP